jgi:ClpP class serine protease
MIKRYTQFVNEAEDANIDETPGVKLDSNKFTELKDEVKKMIDNTISKSGGEFASFVESFEKNPEDVKVEGFINDSDVYDFYLKFRNDIDEILNNLKFYDEAPTEVNAFGLYEYVIKGTERAFMEVVKMINKNPQ